MIRIFSEGKNIMVYADASELAILSEDGVKLKLSPERAKKLLNAIQEICTGYEMIESCEKASVQPNEETLKQIYEHINLKEI